MIDRKAVLHIPMSNMAYALDENTLSFTIRVAKNNIDKCVLWYGDTACRKPHVDFFPVKMQKVASDSQFDYFNATYKSKFHRVCYYFQLVNEGETKLYYGDLYYDEEVTDRSEYYKLPFARREDVATVPHWLSDAVVYNIFPDSFASYKEGISLHGSKIEENGMLSKGMLGGNLRGVFENLDYIQSMGFNTIYLNPIFRAGEYHKYDLLDYYSVDPVFGTNQQFKQLVEACHGRGMKIIIDGVFNHCGWHFFAFEDVLKNGRKSRYWNWFYRLEDPVTVCQNPDDYPTYECFAYERMMPKLNTSNLEVEQYFIDVGKFWVQNFDIDGWRLDVADEVNDRFWRRFREEVKSVKQDVVIIGEVWQTASHWLDGSMFDSAMNYDFRKHAKRYFSEKMSSAQFNDGVVNMLMRYRRPIRNAQLNLLDSHDVPRFRSYCDNEDVYRMAVAFQMMFCGVPSVFYGDEQGFVGMTEAQYRQPMKFDNHPLVDFFRSIIAIRKQYISAIQGKFVTEHVEKDGGLYIFSLTDGNRQLRCVFNTGCEVAVDADLQKGEILMSNNFKNGIASSNSFAIILVK